MHHLFPAGIKWVVDSFCLCMRLSFTPPHLLFLSPNFSWQPSVCCQAVRGWQRTEEVSASLLIRLIALSPWLTYCLSVDDMILLKLVLLSLLYYLCDCTAAQSLHALSPLVCLLVWLWLLHNHLAWKTRVNQAWLNVNWLAGKQDYKTWIVGILNYACI